MTFPSVPDPSASRNHATPCPTMTDGTASVRHSTSVTTCESTGLEPPWGHNLLSDRRRGTPQTGASTAASHPVLIRSWRPSPLDRALRGAR